MSPKLFFITAAMLFFSQVSATASEATKPVPQQKYFSLHSARNMAYKNREVRPQPPKFFLLGQGQRMIPLKRGGAEAKPAAEVSAAPAPVVLTKPKPEALLDMNKTEQAHQLLSIFAAAD